MIYRNFFLIILLLSNHFDCSSRRQLSQKTTQERTVQNKALIFEKNCLYFRLLIS